MGAKLNVCVATNCANSSALICNSVSNYDNLNVSLYHTQFVVWKPVGDGKQLSWNISMRPKDSYKLLTHSVPYTKRRLQLLIGKQSLDQELSSTWQHFQIFCLRDAGIIAGYNTKTKQVYIRSSYV